MKNKKELTKYEIEMLKAIMERPIGAKDLVREILLLLKKYYIAEFELTDQYILMKLRNKQKFKITIEEISG